MERKHIQRSLESYGHSSSNYINVNKVCSIARAPKKRKSITSVGSHHIQEAYSFMKSVQENLSRDKFTVLVST
jgi:hypothetical protein